VLIYSLGWARPDRGLEWWFGAGKPTHDDRRLELLDVYDVDGMLDLFAAWAWTSPQLAPVSALSDLTGYQDDNSRVVPDGEWLAVQERAGAHLGILSPFGGGWDPLHLSAHCSGPLERLSDGPRMLRSGRSRRTAVLVLDSMRGWYRALAELGSALPDLGNRSWHVEVVIRPLGSLGTYRRSRETGLWFAGPHRLHTRGT
jgi:hypothetical protein